MPHSKSGWFKIVAGLAILPRCPILFTFRSLIISLSNKFAVLDDEWRQFTQCPSTFSRTWNRAQLTQNRGAPQAEGIHLHAKNTEAIIIISQLISKFLRTGAEYIGRETGASFRPHKSSLMLKTRGYSYQKAIDFEISRKTGQNRLDASQGMTSCRINQSSCEKRGGDSYHKAIDFEISRDSGQNRLDVRQGLASARRNPASCRKRGGDSEE